MPRGFPDLKSATLQNQKIVKFKRVSQIAGNGVARRGSRPTGPGAILAFTLLEVMLTMGLLMILIASSMAVLTYLNQSAGRLADHTAAMAAVHGHVETIRAATYNPPNAPFYVATTVNLTNQVTVALGKAGTYLAPGTIVSTITPTASGHLVTVTGTFQARGTPLVITLQTLVNRFAGGQQ